MQKIKQISLFNKFLFVTLCVFFVTRSYAQYVPQDWSNPYASAQGNAFSAWANDGTAIFHNPAGISLLHNPASKKHLLGYKDIIAADVEANQSLLTQAHGSSNDNTLLFFHAARNSPYVPSYAAVQTFPHIILGAKRSFSLLLGGYGRTENSAVQVNPSAPSVVTFKSVSTAAGAIAFSHGTEKGFLRWGISFRPNLRWEYYSSNYDLNIYTSENDLYTQIKNKGVESAGMAADAGVSMTFSDYWFPTLGASVRNIPTGCISDYVDPTTYKKESMCGVLRTKSNSSTLNESRLDPTEVHAGISITPRFWLWGTVVNFHMLAEAYPIQITYQNKNYSIPTEDKNLVHLGGELFFGSVFEKHHFVLRGGYQNGAPTWGGTLEIPFFEITYSSYVVPYSVQDSALNLHQGHQRRHLISLEMAL